MYIDYFSSPTQLIITLPMSSEKIKIIFAIDEKSSFIAMNIAIHPRANPMKYPIVAFIILFLKPLLF